MQRYLLQHQASSQYIGWQRSRLLEGPLIQVDSKPQGLVVQRTADWCLLHQQRGAAQMAQRACLPVPGAPRMPRSDAAPVASADGVFVCCFWASFTTAWSCTIQAAQIQSRGLNFNTDNIQNKPSQSSKLVSNRQTVSCITRHSGDRPMRKPEFHQFWHEPSLSSSTWLQCKVTTFATKYLEISVLSSAEGSISVFLSCVSLLQKTFSTWTVKSVKFWM